jgi:hypothetical protein
MMKGAHAQKLAEQARAVTSDQTILLEWSDAQLAEAVDAIHGIRLGARYVKVPFCDKPISVAAIGEEVVRRQFRDLDC